MLLKATDALPTTRNELVPRDLCCVGHDAPRQTTDYSSTQRKIPEKLAKFDTIVR